MKIIDKDGNVLAEKTDLTLGRLEQGDTSDTLVYKTWADFPPTDPEGNIIDLNKPTALDIMQEQLDEQADALIELAALLTEEV